MRAQTSNPRPQTTNIAHHISHPSPQSSQFATQTSHSTPHVSHLTDQNSPHTSRFLLSTFYPTFDISSFAPHTCHSDLHITGHTSRPENPKTDWDDKPGLPRSPFRGVLALFGQKTPKRTEPGLPRVVIPVRFGVILLFSARKPQNVLG